MFYMVTAICLMVNSAGAPVNSCFVQEEAKQYKSYELCNAQMYRYEVEKRVEIINQVGDSAIVVVMTSCLEAKNV